MGNDLEARIGRLERALAHGLGVDIHEHDDPEQQAAHAEQLKQDQKDAEDQAKAAADADAAGETEEVAATPAAAALAEEHGVDLTQVEGSGVGGTITKPDVAAQVEEA